VPGPGQLDPLAPEHPTPTAQLVEDMLVTFAMKIIDMTGTVG
jgi:hypothetical protein